MTLLWLAIAASLGQASATSGLHCTDCHPAGVATHLRDWDRSLHATAGVSCESCHAAPQSSVGPNHGATWSNQTAVVDLCGRCHTAVAQVFRTSPHVRVAMPTGRKPTCVDCHESAGGQVLAEEAFAERCGACHAAVDAPRAGSVAVRGAEVLHDLRRVSLARALVEDELIRRRRRGFDTNAEATSLRLLAADFRDIATEWHRFDLAEAQLRSRRALETLEALHKRLQEETR